jgi:hypothetical protein
MWWRGRKLSVIAFVVGAVSGKGNFEVVERGLDDIERHARRLSGGAG